MNDPTLTPYEYKSRWELIVAIHISSHPRQGNNLLLNYLYLNYTVRSPWLVLLQPAPLAPPVEASWEGRSVASQE